MGMTKGQTAVLGVLEEYGPLPDVALVPIAQHVASVRQSSSSIRSRRAELARNGAVEQVGRTNPPKGRSAVIWGVSKED